MTRTHNDGTYTDKVYVTKCLDEGRYLSLNQIITAAGWKATQIPIKTSINSQGWWLLFSNYLSVEISQIAHVLYSFGYWELFVEYVTDA